MRSVLSLIVLYLTALYRPGRQSRPSYCHDGILEIVYCEQLSQYHHTCASRATSSSLPCSSSGGRRHGTSSWHAAAVLAPAPARPPRLGGRGSGVQHESWESSKLHHRSPGAQPVVSHKDTGTHIARCTRKQRCDPPDPMQDAPGSSGANAPDPMQDAPASSGATPPDPMMRLIHRRPSK